jgi:hypothetical protein
VSFTARPHLRLTAGMETFSIAPPTPADLRAALARHRIPLYLVSARLRIHPIRLGKMIGERVAMPSGLADRIMRAIEEEARSR